MDLTETLVCCLFLAQPDVGWGHTHLLKVTLRSRQLLFCDAVTKTQVFQHHSRQEREPGQPSVFDGLA